MLLEVYALHLSRDLAYIVGVAPINSTLCNTFHQEVVHEVIPHPRFVFVLLFACPSPVRDSERTTAFEHECHHTLRGSHFGDLGFACCFEFLS
jgi:hypothetical protein